MELKLFYHLMQERWRRANKAMERANRAKERILSPLKWQTRGSTT
jgi:hypothetical protein